MSGSVMVAGMRAELRDAGYKELRTPEDVDQVIGKYQSGEKKGKLVVVVNSVCGCAGGVMRPAVKKLATILKDKPEYELTTVFAGQDPEATIRAREYFVGMPPSSPSVVIMEDGKVSHMQHRSMIEGRSMDDVYRDLEGKI